MAVLLTRLDLVLDAPESCSVFWNDVAVWGFTARGGKAGWSNGVSNAPSIQLVLMRVLRPLRVAVARRRWFFPTRRVKNLSVFAAGLGDLTRC